MHLNIWSIILQNLILGLSMNIFRKTWTMTFKLHWFIILFDLILYVPVNNFSVMSGQVFLGWTSTKQGLMCLLKDTMQWRGWGSNLISSQAFCHCASLSATWFVTIHCLWPMAGLPTPFPLNRVSNSLDPDHTRCLGVQTVCKDSHKTVADESDGLQQQRKSLIIPECDLFFVSYI